MSESKKDEDWPEDMWLHVATDSIARYAAMTGNVVLESGRNGLIIKLKNVVLDNPAIHKRFVKLAQSKQ